MKDDPVYLKHDRDAATTIDRYVSVGRERFFGESQWPDATIGQLQVIGEADRFSYPGRASVGAVA